MRARLHHRQQTGRCKQTRLAQHNRIPSPNSSGRRSETTTAIARDRRYPHLSGTQPCATPTVSQTSLLLTSGMFHVCHLPFPTPLEKQKGFFDGVRAVRAMLSIDCLRIDTNR